jgi:hypothetical protein
MKLIGGINGISLINGMKIRRNLIQEGKEYQIISIHQLHE